MKTYIPIKNTSKTLSNDDNPYLNRGNDEQNLIQRLKRSLGVHLKMCELVKDFENIPTKLFHTINIPNIVYS